MEVIFTTGCVTARPLAHFNLLFSTLCHEARMGSGAKDMRAERDRFVAFAFSAADLMLEIAGDGSVLFVSGAARLLTRSEEHTSELQSLMRISYAVFCLKKKTTNRKRTH